MDLTEFVDAVKGGHPINATQAIAHDGYDLIINEFLNVMQAAIRESLDTSGGDVAMMYDGERGLFELYASWDYHNTGDRKTSDELVKEYNDRLNQGDQEP
jgi:hypothetical protein